MHLSNGLALMRSAETLRHYRLPVAPPETASVASCFHLLPMVELVDSASPYYVLALNANGCRFYCASPLGIEELELPPAVVSGLTNSRVASDIEQHLEFHTGTPPSGGARPAVYHGQADKAARHRQMLRDYFRTVDRFLQRLAPGNDGRPVVLAGSAYYLPLYREASSCAHLTDAAVTGSTEQMDESELHRRSLVIMRSRRLSRRRQMMEDLGAALSSGTASTDEAEVLRSSSEGRVAVLLCASEGHLWGRFDSEDGYPEIRPKPEGADEDLINWAAVRTLRHGGIVHAVESFELPAGAPMAALFRYRL